MAGSTSYDAYWFAESATAAAWATALLVEAGSDDIAGALVDRDYSTACEAAYLTRLKVRYCQSLLEGHSPVSVDEISLLALAASDRDATNELIGISSSATDTEDQAAAETVERALERLRASMPFDMPLMRTPEGFFPSVRVAAELLPPSFELGTCPI